MRTTVRQHMNPGAVAEKHNSRDEILAVKEEHIDTEKGIHEVWVADRTTEEAYADIFGEAIEKYNEKQKRKDRKITVESYMQSVEEDSRGRRKTKRQNGKKIIDMDAKQGKRLVYESVISVGNSTEKERDGKRRTVYKKVNKQVGELFHPAFQDGLHESRPLQMPYEVNYRACKRFAEEFETRNPQMVIVRADWHADEGYENRRGTWEWGIPHAHIEWLPLATGYKKGLEVQNSIGKCLEQMGYGSSYEAVLDADGRVMLTREGNIKLRFVTAYEKWNKAEQKAFEKIVQEEYEDWCKEHPLWLLEYGMDVEFVHPVAGKDDVQNLAPEQFREVQRLKDRIEEKYEVLKHTEKKITEKHAEYDTAEKMVVDKRAEYDTATQMVAEKQAEYHTTEQKIADKQDEYDSVSEEVLYAHDELSTVAGALKIARQDIKDAAKMKISVDEYKENVEGYCDALREETEASAQQILQRMQKLLSDFEEELQKKYDDYDDADVSRAKFMRMNPRVESAYETWVQKEREAKLSEQKRALEVLRAKRAGMAQDVLAEYTENEFDRDMYDVDDDGNITPKYRKKR